MPKEKNYKINSLTFNIKHFSEVTSTNDEASKPCWEHGDVIWAEYQTKGRGQRGSQWASEQGLNLTCSIVLKPQECPAENQFYISKIISLSLIKALSDHGLSATIKWPNDIYFEDKKLAGILIENDLMGISIKKSIIGVGLNINQELFDPALPNPTSMILTTGYSADRKAVLMSILDHFQALYEDWQKGDNEIDSDYKAALYRKKGTYNFQEPGKKPFVASIFDVLPNGELVLFLENGRHKSYLFKEVEFII